MVEALLERVRDNPVIFGRDGDAQQRTEALVEYVPLADAIERFWLEGTNREAGTWTGNLEINMVKLATSLVPGEFLAV